MEALVSNSQAGVAQLGSPEALSALRSFKASGLLGVAGVAATTTDTGQQWDFPNAWPPIQDLLIQGFQSTGGDAPSCCLFLPHEDV